MSSLDKAFIRAFTKEPSPPEEKSVTEAKAGVNGQIHRMEIPSPAAIETHHSAPHIDFSESPLSEPAPPEKLQDEQVIDNHLGGDVWNGQPIVAMGEYVEVKDSPPRVSSNPPAPWTTGQPDLLRSPLVNQFDEDAVDSSIESIAPTDVQEPIPQPLEIQSDPPLVDPETNIDGLAAEAKIAADAGQAEVDSEQVNDEKEPVEASSDEEQGMAAVWEVNRFVWPEICNALDVSIREHFLQAGDKLFAASKEGLNVLGVTSRVRGEGRTTVALCLARAAASHGARVAVIDADVAKPELAARLGMQTPCSWHDYLLDRLPAEEVAINAVEDGVTLLPLSRTAQEDPIPLDSRETYDKIMEIEEHFDLVILDLGPMNAEPEHLLAADCIDAMVVVRDLRHSSTDQTLEAVERIHRRGIDAVGIVENFTSDD